MPCDDCHRTDAMTPVSRSTAAVCLVSSWRVNRIYNKEMNFDLTPVSMPLIGIHRAQANCRRMPEE